MFKYIKMQIVSHDSMPLTWIIKPHVWSLNFMISRDYHTIHFSYAAIPSKFLIAGDKTKIIEDCVATLGTPWKHPDLETRWHMTTNKYKNTYIHLREEMDAVAFALAVQ